MPFRVEQTTGLDISEYELMQRGYSCSAESDMAEFGFPWGIETPQPSPLHIRGPNEQINGQWHMAWLAPTPATFAERQAELIRAVDQHAAAIRNAIVADISPAEMASWPIKRAEALAWQQSENAADAPNLSMEADARECSLADLVARVLAKAVALSAIEAQIAGHTGKLQDQIRAVEEGDSAALEAIDITAGWPEVGE